MADDAQGYAIELLGFPQKPASEAASALAQAFAIPVDRAQRLVERVPVRVKSAAPKVEAERYVKALLKAGADVKLSGGGTSKVYRASDYAAAGALAASVKGPSGPTSGLHAAPPTKQPSPAPGRAPAGPSTAQPTAPGRTNLDLTETITCPKCGTPQPRSSSCNHCGIIFEKFSRRVSSSINVPAVGPERVLVRTAIPSGDSAAIADDPLSGGFSAAPAALMPASRPGGNPYSLGVSEDDGLFNYAEPVFAPGQQLFENVPPARGLALAPAAPSSGASPRVPSAGIPSVAASRVPGASVPNVSPASGDPIELDAADRPRFAGPRGAVAFVPPAMAIRRPTGRAAEMTRGSTDVGFWNNIGRAFAFSVKGPSYQYFVLSGLLGLAMAALMWAMSKSFGMFSIVLGGGGVFSLFSAFCAVQWRFYHGAFFSAVSCRDDGHSPISDIFDFRAEYMWPGMILGLAGLILLAPVIIIIFNAVDPSAGARPVNPTTIFLLSLIPLVYWPMGMAFVSSNGRLTDVFIVHGVIRGIVIGGLEYLFITLIGVGAFVLPGLLARQAEGPGIIHWVVLFVILCYAAGVQGYLTGKLLRRRPSLIKGAVVETTDYEDDGA